MWIETGNEKYNLAMVISMERREDGNVTVRFVNGQGISVEADTAKRLWTRATAIKAKAESGSPPPNEEDDLNDDRLWERIF